MTILTLLNCLRFTSSNIMRLFHISTSNNPLSILPFSPSFLLVRTVIAFSLTSPFLPFLHPLLLPDVEDGARSSHPRPAPPPPPALPNERPCCVRLAFTLAAWPKRKREICIITKATKKRGHKPVAVGNNAPPVRRQVCSL